MQRWLTASLLSLALVAMVASTAAAFPSSGDCMGCHNTFTDSGQGHSRHQTILGCRDCHISIGDTPKTNESGNFAEYSCNGCHVEGGIVNFHVDAGFTSCAQAGCHNGVSKPASEAELAFFYTDGRSGLVNPCRSNAANGGEDLDSSGRGLDNDADGLRDVDDPDCANIVPIDAKTWSTLKGLFELD